MKIQTSEILKLLEDKGSGYPLFVGILDQSIRTLVGQNLIEHMIDRSPTIYSDEELVEWLETHDNKHLVFVPETNPASDLGKKSAKVRKKKGHNSEYYSALAKRRWRK